MGKTSLAYFHSILQMLLEEAIRLSEELKSQGRLRPTVIHGIKRVIKEFTYDNRGISQITISYVPYEWEDWSEAIFNIINTLRDHELYSKCEGIISLVLLENCQDPPASPDIYLGKFLRRTLIDYFNGIIKFNNDFSRYIDLFISEVSCNPHIWRAKVWLQGLYMDVDSIRIDDFVTLKRPTKKDLEEDGFDEPRAYPSAILEVEMKTTEQELQQQINRLIHVLRLYRAGSVYYTRIYKLPESFIKERSLISDPTPKARTYIYGISDDDKEKLPFFWNIIRNTNMPLDEYGRIAPKNHIGIAMLRYKDALLKAEPLDIKIAYSIMGLEALYLRNEATELSRTLRERVAKILSIFGDDSIMVRDTLKNAYKIRSAFVHGSISNKNQRELKEILDRVIEYLRKSILIFMQIDIDKKDLLSLIDDALLDCKAHENLERLLKEEVVTLGGNEANIQR